MQLPGPHLLGVLYSSPFPGVYTFVKHGTQVALSVPNINPEAHTSHALNPGVHVLQFSNFCVHLTPDNPSPPSFDDAATKDSPNTSTNTVLMLMAIVYYNFLYKTSFNL